MPTEPIYNKGGYIPTEPEIFLTSFHDPGMSPICSIPIKTAVGIVRFDVGPGYLSVDDAVKLIEALRDTPKT
jgi:hypothetical protein